MRFAATVVTFAIGATIATVANATVIVSVPGLFNTGVNNSNVTLADNATDTHWKLTAAPVGVTLGNTYTGAKNGTFPLAGNWLTNNTTSRWITPTISHANAAPGDYTYELQFTLTPLMIASTGQFTGRYAVDNSMVSVMLNSTALTAPAGSLSGFTNFSATSGFVAGLNKLTFKTRNGTGATGNPTGFRMEFLTNSIEVLPEPGSWALMIAGFGLVGAAQRRKRAFTPA